MKYPFMVNHNGVYYPAGTEVPVGDSVGNVVNAEVEASDEMIKEEVSGEKLPDKDAETEMRDEAPWTLDEDVEDEVPDEEVVKESPKRGRKLKGA